MSYLQALLKPIKNEPIVKPKENTVMILQEKNNSKKKLTYTELYAEQYKQQNFLTNFHSEYNGTQEVLIFTEDCYDGTYDIPKFKSKNGNYKYLFVQPKNDTFDNYDNADY